MRQKTARHQEAVDRTIKDIDQVLQQRERIKQNTINERRLQHRNRAA